jgi:cytochrome c553
MCHGLDGVGDSAGALPLTGQATFYMYKQLIDHATEARLNDAMTPIARDTAADLSDEDIRAVALYFEWLRPREDDGRGGARVSAHEPERNGG